jgi:hypothetical protein
MKELLILYAIEGCINPDKPEEKAVKKKKSIL